MYRDYGSKPEALLSYLTLRRTVGILGVSLPWLLVLFCMLWGGCAEIQDSISDYYGTDARDVFVGVLFVIGLFLFAYRGYELKDDMAGDIACVSAIGVALFSNTRQPVIHFTCAAILFLVLAYFSYFLFTKTAVKGNETPEKLIRNKWYKGCGIFIVVTITLVPISRFTLPHATVDHWNLVYWLETVALTAFGLSWFIKGEAWLADRVKNP